MPASAEMHVSDAPLPLFGHTDILNRVHVGLQQNRLHHGWILGGDEGIGKFRLAQQIAAWILSVADDNSAGLFEGEAPASLHPSAVPVDGEEARLVFGNAHPDLLVIQPEEDEKNKSGLIKTEQIRKLPAFFAHHSARSKWRVAIVDNLDVGLLDNVLLLAKQSGMDSDALKTLIDEGDAAALLMSDYQKAAELNIKGSPSWIMNNGRQELFGNVGYRILRANIKEVLSKPGYEASWC